MRRALHPFLAASIPSVFLAAFLAAILATGLAGCQQLFTTSLGKALARDSLPIPATLTPSQAADLAIQAQDNPKLASALVSSLVTQISGMPASAAKTELQASAASAAIVASGTSAALTGLFTDFGKTGTIPTDTATITNLLKTIKSGSSGTGVVAALSYLDPKNGIADATTSGLGATDYAIAAVVIAASVLPADPSAMTPAEVTAFQASPQGLSAIAILNQATSLVTAGSQSASLLSSLTTQFKL